MDSELEMKLERKAGGTDTKGYHKNLRLDLKATRQRMKA